MVQKSLRGKKPLEARENQNRIVIFVLMRKTYHVDELKSGIANFPIVQLAEGKTYSPSWDKLPIGVIRC